MKAGLFRDALLVVAPCAAVLAGLASVDHRQRLVEAGYRVARLEKERDALALEVEHRRVCVANLSSPVRLLGESRERKLGLDYPIHWNEIAGDGEAAGLLAKRAAPKAAAVQKKTGGVAAKPRAGGSAPSAGKPSKAAKSGAGRRAAPEAPRGDR
jgi:hypothetical protein